MYAVTGSAVQYVSDTNCCALPNVYGCFAHSLLAPPSARRRQTRPLINVPINWSNFFPIFLMLATAGRARNNNSHPCHACVRADLLLNSPPARAADCQDKTNTPMTPTIYAHQPHIRQQSKFVIDTHSLWFSVPGHQFVVGLYLRVLQIQLERSHAVLCTFGPIKMG